MSRILIVDDDQLIGMLLAAMLEDMALHVCGIETTQSGAVAAASHLRPDLMIVDVKLGAGSGIAAMAEIERHGPMPHIFMSGEKLPPTVGGARTLMKPFTERQLSTALREALPRPAT